MLGSPRDLLPGLPDETEVGGTGQFVPMSDLGQEIDGVLFHRRVPAGGEGSSAVTLKRRWCVVADGHMLVYRWKGKEKATQSTAESLKATLVSRPPPSLCMVSIQNTPNVLRCATPCAGAAALHGPAVLLLQAVLLRDG